MKNIIVSLIMCVTLISCIKKSDEPIELNKATVEEVPISAWEFIEQVDRFGDSLGYSLLVGKFNSGNHSLYFWCTGSYSDTFGSFSVYERGREISLKDARLQIRTSTETFALETSERINNLYIMREPQRYSMNDLLLRAGIIDAILYADDFIELLKENSEFRLLFENGTSSSIVFNITNNGFFDLYEQIKEPPYRLTEL